VRRLILLIGLVIAGLFLIVKPPWLLKAGRDSGALELAAPAGDQPTYINPSGETVLPNGRLITPEGVQVTVEPHPYGMALSPDGNLLVTANTGTWPFSLSIISALASNAPRVQQIPSDMRIFDPGKARDPLYSQRMGKPLPPSEPLDDPARIRREMNGGR